MRYALVVAGAAVAALLTELFFHRVFDYLEEREARWRAKRRRSTDRNTEGLAKWWRRKEDLRVTPR
jgi:hypothetical protein